MIGLDKAYIVNVNKKKFAAKFGKIDIDHEMDPANKNPNQFIFKYGENCGVTHEHALKALYHPNVYMGKLAAKSKYVKRSDLVNYMHDPKGNDDVKQSISLRFDHDRLHGKNPNAFPTPAYQSKDYYPEDKE